MNINIGKMCRLIEEKRQDLGLTQAELAKEALNLGEAQYRNLIHKRSDITFIQVNKLCQFLGISAVNIVTKSSLEGESLDKLKAVCERGIEDFTNILKELENNSQNQG